MRIRLGITLSWQIYQEVIEPLIEEGGLLILLEILPKLFIGLVAEVYKTYLEI